MADESVRSLLATLGFELDNTKADQFEARFKKLESTMKVIAGRIDKIDFNPKIKPKKKTLSRARRLGRLLRKNLLDGAKIKSSDQIFKGLKSGLKRSFKKAKILALAGGAALAATIGKGLLKFTDVESAKFALRFQAENLGVDFDKILKQLKDVRDETENVVDELDTLQALNVGFQLTGNFESVAGNMESVIKFASVLNKDLSEVQRTFSEFVLTGGNLAELKKFGFFDQAQIEALKRAGTGFGPVAERERTKILDVKIAEQIGRLDKSFVKFSGTNAALIAKIKVLTSEGLVSIGKGVTTSAREDIEDFQKLFDFKKGSTTTEKLSTFGGRALDRTVKGFEDDINKIKEFFGAPSTNTVNQNNTININGNDIESMKKAVGEVVKDAAQIELRKTPDIATPTNFNPNLL